MSLCHTRHMIPPLLCLISYARIFSEQELIVWIPTRTLFSLPFHPGSQIISKYGWSNAKRRRILLGMQTPFLLSIQRNWEHWGSDSFQTRSFVLLMYACPLLLQIHQLSSHSCQDKWKGPQSLIPSHRVRIWNYCRPVLWQNFTIQCLRPEDLSDIFHYPVQDEVTQEWRDKKTWSNKTCCLD